MSSEQTSKFIHNFKKGDIVHFHGARFECIEDAHESFIHAPYAAPSALMVRKRAATSNTVAPGRSRATSWPAPT